MTEELNVGAPEDALEEEPVAFAEEDVIDAPPRPEPMRQPCPFCSEPILPQARRCPMCTEYLDPALAAAAHPRPVSRLAVSSFMMGLLAPLALFVTGPIALILGLVALTSRNTRGKGLATAGVLLGLVWTAALVLTILNIVHSINQGQLVDPGPLF
ncbi:DUF4190 domain-containing protein [bacterium]|nr:DUF4190 domain-containing protein [bacterium]